MMKRARGQTPPEESGSLGKRILLVRLEMSAALGRYITKKEFAHLVGLAFAELNGTAPVPFSESSGSRWESDSQYPEPETLDAMVHAARRAGVPVDMGWLIGGAQSAAPGPRSRVVEASVPLPRPSRRGLRPERHPERHPERGARDGNHASKHGPGEDAPGDDEP